MLSKIISIGNKIELSRVANSAATEFESLDNNKKIYYSQVYDFIDENRLKIGMPIDSGKVVPLNINTRYDACFYTTNGLYQCRVLVVDRYKEGNIFILIVEIISDLQKYQRRQYFRLGCTMDISYKILDDIEIRHYLAMQDKTDYLQDEALMEGIALDISGGGVRFISRAKHNINDELFVILRISYDGNEKKYGILGKIIAVDKVRNREGTYEYRVEYRNMQGGIREDLIKYIFEEERKQRQKTRI